MDQSATAALSEEIQIQGIGVSPGVVIAPLVVINREEIRIPSSSIEEKDIPQEMERLHQALVQTREQIQSIQSHISQSMGDKNASIFDAHLLVVEDTTLLEAVKKQMATQKKCVECVYHNLMMTYARSMRELGDPYLQERATDLIDVGRRVLHNLMGKKIVDIYELDEPSILISHDLSPSDTALLDRTKVYGFATDLGSPTSHSAIMARSLNLPAVVGLKNITLRIKSGDQGLLDGYRGLLILNPSKKTLEDYGQLSQKRSQIAEKLNLLRQSQAVTADGRRILVSANVELPEDLLLLEHAGAEGIGLYRTEFLFINRTILPTEEEQIHTYKKIFEAGGQHGAIIRTLDIGADKMPSNQGLEKELNPFLGWRAIRYCLEEKKIFCTQLRAICRAAAGYPKARLMFPMIAALEELKAARALLSEVLEELARSNVPHAENIEVGMMIEVPSAALIADKLIDHVDFFSIGTNDLIGYTLAVDRTNSKVAYLYQPTHPAILKLISLTVEAAHKKGKWVGVCGETAGDIYLTPLLIGLGVDELSMGSISIPRVKKAIQSLSYEKMRELAHELLETDQAETGQKKLQQIAQTYYPELLI